MNKYKFRKDEIFTKIKDHNSNKNLASKRKKKYVSDLNPYFIYQEKFRIK